ncbi:MAG: Eco57I restriction-modification methylase domain-containing protein, partial [Candidatus Hermodarchaeota archaeon]
IKNSSSKTDKTIGQIFTSSYIAEFMVNNLKKYIIDWKTNPNTIRILEPSVGEGIFLKFLLKNNFTDITAYEIDTSLKENLLNLYPNVEFHFENFLGAGFDEKFDIIIGNPPYLGQNYNSEVFQDYVKKFSLCKKYFIGNMDFFYYFIHMGIEKLNPGGLLTFITTNYWITKSKKTGIKYLKPHILEECFLLQYIDLSHLQLFEGAKGQHNCIFVLQKKTEQDKFQKKNRNIEVIQLFRVKNLNQNSFNETILRDLMYNVESNKIKKYTSALTNHDLRKDHSWNLLYSEEVKSFTDKFEKYCKVQGKISLLKDFFIIRNGLILIKDSIFILNEGKDLKIRKNDFFININGEFIKLNNIEKYRIKRIYKSKSIKPFGYQKEKNGRYLIYFNKNEFNSEKVQNRNIIIESKYQTLSKYLKQFKFELEDILTNAKENPEDIYFPRRGSFIRMFNQKNIETLLDLEPLYDSHPKIFFKYISEENVFGYSDEQYYATSDTYFLWPKIPEENIDYLFILAYLNSKVVQFLYKAKNIKIKRSKTKLEQVLPIPNLENFQTPGKIEIVNLIKILTKFLITNSIDNKLLNNNLRSLAHFSGMNYNESKNRIFEAIKLKKNDLISEYIDYLFYQLFEISESKLNFLLKKYYNP